MPRIDPSVRLIHGVAEASDDEDDLPPPPKPPRPTTTNDNVARARLDDDGLRKLQAALHELGECRRLIEAAVARTD